MGKYVDWIGSLSRDVDEGGLTNQVCQNVQRRTKICKGLEQILEVLCNAFDYVPEMLVAIPSLQ